MSTNKSTAQRWEVPATDGYSRKWVGWSEDGYYFLETQEPTGPRWILDSDPSDDDKPFRILARLMTVTFGEVDWHKVDWQTRNEIEHAPTLLWISQPHDDPREQEVAKLLAS